jgi:uncharacterized cupin superfamily protein
MDGAAVSEAHVEETEHGRVAQGDGWFVLNLAEARWETLDGAGAWCAFEADDARFPHVGAGVHVLWPGQPNGRYHAESNQEGFFVLAGECVAVVEGEERRLRQWDFLHCPPGTNHILVGAGDGPCAIFMFGARDPNRTIHYPVDEVAARYGASVSRATSSPKEAYADVPQEIAPRRAPWP